MDVRARLAPARTGNTYMSSSHDPEDEVFRAMAARRMQAQQDASPQPKGAAAAVAGASPANKLHDPQDEIFRAMAAVRMHNNRETSPQLKTVPSPTKSPVMIMKRPTEESKDAACKVANPKAVAPKSPASAASQIPTASDANTNAHRGSQLTKVGEPTGRYTNKTPATHPNPLPRVA